MQWLVRRQLSRLAAKTDTRWDDHLVAAIGKTKFIFLVIVGIFAGSLTLDLRPVTATVVQTLVVIALVVQVGLWLNLIVKRSVATHREQAKEHDPAQVSTISMIGLLLSASISSSLDKAMMNTPKKLTVT